MNSFLGQPRFPPCRKQMSLERIMKTNPLFDAKNPLTYKYYLKKNTELSAIEIEYYENLIYFMEQERQQEIELIRSVMKDSREVLNQINDIDIDMDQLKI